MSLATIRHATVGEVLRQLARGTAPTRTPLEELEQVRRALHGAGFEATPRARRHELARLLVQLVEEELQHLRRMAGACDTLPRTARSEDGIGSRRMARGGAIGEQRAAAASGAVAVATARPLLPPAAYLDAPEMLRARIQEDFGQGHAALEAQSAIYHLYLRPDIGLSLDEFVTLLGDRHRRTVQRRLRRGVAMVTARLHERERAAVLATRREQLVARLPHATGRLVGFANAVEALADGLADGRSVLLAGEAGAGKSALARAAAARLLAADALDDLVWLETDVGGRDGEGLERGAEPIVAELRRRLRRPAAEGCHDVLLVIDGLDRPGTARAAATAAGALGLTSLLVGRATPAALRHGAARLTTPPALGPRAAKALLRQEMTRRGVAHDDREWPAVVAATAGNPRALRRAAAAMRATAPAEVARLFVAGRGPAGALYARMWAAAWRAAPAAARESVRAVIALRRGGIVAHAANVARLRGLPATAAGEGLDAALDAGLLAATPQGAFVPGRFLRRWLAVTGRCDAEGRSEGAAPSTAWGRVAR